MKIVTDKYMLLFDFETGFEILSGVNGHPDPFALDYPSLLDIGVMGHCSNFCDICYQGGNKEPHMTLDTYTKIIKESTGKTGQIAIGGRGDPNMHPNFKEIIDTARKYEILPNYTTSGNGFTDLHADISKGCGAVAVSNYKKDFTYKAIKKLLSRGIKTNIHFVLTRESVREAIELLDGVNIWGTNIELPKINAIVFLLFKPQGKSKDMLHLIPYEEHLLQFFSRIKNDKHTFKVGMDSCLANHYLRTPFCTKTDHLFIDTCEGARMSAYVTPRGDFKPCSFAPSTMDYAAPTLQEAWESDLFINFRESLATNKYSCPLF